MLLGLVVKDLRGQEGQDDQLEDQDGQRLDQDDQQEGQDGQLEDQDGQRVNQGPILVARQAYLLVVDPGEE